MFKLVQNNTIITSNDLGGVMNAENKLATFDKNEVAEVALRAFFNIVEKWQLRDQDSIALLGSPSRSTFYSWKRGNASALSPDTTERISLVLGVYKALRILFPTAEQAHQWINKPNTFFGGKPARESFCKGSIINMLDMRRYLDGMRG